MEKAFYAPARYKMAIPGQIKGIAGGLIFPAGIPAPTLIRRDRSDLGKKYPHLQRRLLDPQLYLAVLPSVTCRKTCVNLASYGWFITEGIKQYESAKQDQSEWKREAMARIHKAWKGTIPTSEAQILTTALKATAFQQMMGCEAILLPSPLTAELSSDYSVELGWLDIGLKAAETQAPGIDRFASIALSDTSLRGLDPWHNDLLTVIIDQITARMPEGAYIVIEQSNEHGYYCTHPNTVGSLLRLVYQLKEAGLKRVVVGPIGLAGLLAAAVGADIWSAGWYRGERRVLLADYQDQMGMAVPTYYSHALAGEIHLEDDLDRLVKRGFLSQLEEQTGASKGLITALKLGRSVRSVPEWQHRQSNVGAATEHFFAVAARETAKLNGQTKAGCLGYAHEWLQSAEKLASKLYSVGGFNPRTELSHQAAWLQAFERFLEEAAP
jgi:hypothetical protein